MKYVSKMSKLYGATADNLNELCWEFKAREIVGFSEYYITPGCDVLKLGSNSDPNKRNPLYFVKIQPDRITTKHKIPEYRLSRDSEDARNFSDRPMVRVTVDYLYMCSYYGEMPYEESIHYKKGETFDPSELRYRITSLQKMDDNNIRINGLHFKRIINTDGTPLDYFISENGVVYSARKQAFLRHNVDYKGYRSVSIPGVPTRQLYRILYNTWANKIPWVDPAIHIDHIDGIKSHNYFSNLRETTYLKNFRNTLEQGLRNYQYTEAEVHELCKLIESNQYSPKEMAEKLGRPHKQVAHEIKDIMQGKIWKDISRQYNLEPYRSQIHGAVAPTKDEKIHEICKIAEERQAGLNNYTNNQISEITGVGVMVVNTVLRGKNRTDISSQYNIPLQNTYDRMKPDEAREVCREIIAGVNRYEIAKRHNRKERVVRDIVNGRLHPKIGQEFEIWKYKDQVLAGKKPEWY